MPEGRRRRAAAMSEGTLGHDLWPALDVQMQDEIVRKYRFSAFLPGASSCRPGCGARVRHGADHRHPHECLLRIFGTGCDDG